MSYDATTPVRVRVSWPGQPDAVWTASRLYCGDSSPAEIVAQMNRRAQLQGLDATYTLATEAEYWAYRNWLRSA